jgi:hypothetical protein
LLKLRSSWLPWIIFSLWKYWGIRVGYDRMYIIILPPLLSFRHTIIEDSEFIKRRLYENTKNSARNDSVKTAWECKHRHKLTGWNSNVLHLISIPKC